jgi:hypothetical protein
MKVTYFPDEPTVKSAIKIDEPMLVLVSHCGSEMIISNIDDAMEHHILLRKVDRRETEIDNFFRVIVNNAGADWTFACPADYKKIDDRNKRIETFYNDGIEVLGKALKKIGYDVPVKIPDRYRRHFNTLGQ